MKMKKMFEAVVEAYQLFNLYVEDSELGNLTKLNSEVNTPIAVEPALYDALQAIAEAGDRHVFLAAVKRYAPEKYRSLTVRLYGFSEYFIALPPWQQQAVLNRTVY